jgi:hypothetical protein
MLRIYKYNRKYLMVEKLRQVGLMRQERNEQFMTKVPSEISE